MFRKIILFCCFALTAFVAHIHSPAAFAQKVWNGSFDSDWANSSNWDMADTPNPGDNVVIGGSSMTITNVSGILLNDLTINAAGPITLQGSGTITITGALAINSPLILDDNMNIVIDIMASGNVASGAYLGILGGTGARVGNGGTLTVSAGGEVRILGNTTIPAINGGDLAYAAGSTLLYQFGGFATQNAGAELPTTMDGDVILDMATNINFRLLSGRTLNGSLTFDQGTFNINGESLTLNGAVSIAPTNAFFQGFGGSVTIGGAGALNGAWNFNIGNTLANLTIARMNATMILQTDLTVTSELALWAGHIDCAAFGRVLYVQNASGPAVVGGNSSSYVITSAASGLLRRRIPIGMSANPFKFPVGTVAGYFPYSLFNANASGDIDVQVAADDAVPSDAIISSHYLDVQQFGGAVTLEGWAMLESPLVQSVSAVAISAVASPFSAYTNLPIINLMPGSMVLSQPYTIDATSRYVALAGNPTPPYAWVGQAGADWQNPASWSPPRFAPAASDELIFNAGVHTPTNIPHQTISMLSVRAGANVTLSASNPANWLTTTGYPTGVYIEAGGSLDLGAPATNITLNIAASSECVVEGRLQTQNSAVRGEGYFSLENDGLLATTRDDGINGASVSGGAVQTGYAWYSSQARYEFTSASPGEERDMNFMAQGGKNAINFMRALYVGASAGTRRLNSAITVGGGGLLAVQKAAAAAVLIPPSTPEIVIQGRMTLHSSRNSSLTVGNEARLVVRDGGELWNNGRIQLYDDNEVFIDNGFLTMVGPNGGGGSGTGSIEVGYGTIRYSGASMLSFTGGGSFTTDEILLPPSMPARVSVSNASVVVLDGDKQLLAGLELLSGGKMDLNNNHLTLTGFRAEGGGLLASAGSFRGSRYSSLSLGGALAGDIAFDDGFATLGSLTVNFTSSAPPALRGNVQIMNSLSLQNGILSVSEPNALTLAAEAPSSLVGGSATSYIRGAFRRAMQANIASDGQTYFFPVGDTAYRPFALANARTGGSAPTVLGRSFASGANSWLAPLSGGAAYNWFAQPLSGAFQSATFQAGAPNVSFPAGLRVATAPAQNGDYADIGADDLSPLRSSMPQAARLTANGAYFALGGAAPTIVSFSPRAARPGETVTITGAFLTGVTGARFGGVPAQSFVVVSPTQITAVVGETGASGALAVQSPLGETTAALPFTWLGQPTITSVSPVPGAVGQTLTIRGTEYHPTPEVRIGDLRAASVTAASLTELRVVFAQATTGVLTIHASGGSVSWRDPVSLLAPPTITNISAINPQPGSLLTVTGTNFTQGFTQAFIGSVPVQATVNSPTQITIVAPATNVNAPLRIVTPAGTAISTVAVVVVPPPSISDVTPASARAGESLAIRGDNFINVESVLIGNIPTSFIVHSTTSITAVAPFFGSSAETSSASVRVRTRTGEASYSRFVTLRRSPAPTMSLLSFAPADVAEGDSVAVVGANIPPTARLRLRSSFAEVVVAPFLQTPNGGASSLRFRVPAGLISPQITATEATITAEAEFPSGLQTAQAPTTLRIRAADAPAFTGFAPLIGGSFTPIVLSGQNFNVSPRGTVQQILIGGVPVREFIVVSPTEIRAIAGQSAGGAITIITGSGALTTSASFAVNPLLDVEPVQPSDSLALDALFAATGGQMWTTSTNWTNGFPVALRFGVRVEGGRVVELVLRGNNLSGTPPWEALAALTALRALNIADNAVGGALPQNLCGLSSLRELNLAGNRFEGGVDALCCLPATVESLHLGRNRLSGFLPECLRNLQRLQTFDVERNLFIGGFPTFLTQLPQITSINLRGNGFSGIVPPAVGNFPVAAAAKARNSALAAVEGLRRLDIGENNFSGEIPQEIGAFIGLRELLLDGNQFTGALPPSIGNLQSLQTLNARNNSLDAVPDLARAIPRLQAFDAAGNRLGFDNLERLVSIPFFTYAPQRIQPPAVSNADAVLGFPLELRGALAGEHNRYQWFKNGAPIGEPAENDALFFPALALADTGTYFCAITNAKLPLLTVSTATFFVRGVLPDSPPAPPLTLLSPAPSETDVPTSPLFRWSAADGANLYRIEISESSAFSELAGAFTAPQTAETLRSGEMEIDARAQGLARLRNQTRYFWRVRAENARGNGEWTSGDFTTAAAEQILAAQRLDFGKVPLGDTAVGVVIVRNLSASDVRLVGAIASDHPAFIFDAPESAEIPAGADIRVRARFIPSARETVVASVRIPFVAGVSAQQTQNVANRLIGRGGALKIIPQSVDTSVVGSVKLLAVQVENRANAATTITRLELRRGAREYSFRADAGDGIPLGAGDTTAVLVKFTAERAGASVEEIYCESSIDTVRASLVQYGRARRANDILANVSVRAVPPSAPPGAPVTLEIYLAGMSEQERRNALLSTVPLIRASVRLNRNVLTLHPSAESFARPIGAPDAKNAEQRYRIAPTYWEGVDSALFRIPCLAVAGVADTTRLTLEELGWGDASFHIKELSEGTFTTLISRAGGKRRIGAAQSATTAEIVGVSPNPAGAELRRISFALARRYEHVQLRIVDMLGGTAFLTVRGAMEAGTHSVELDLRNLPSGQYTAILEADAERASSVITVAR